jgi:hypothetical protein
MKANQTCKYFRTKKMFIPALADESSAHESPEVGYSSHCWCNRTLTETGPDDRPVAGGICNPDRSCFEE